MEISISGEGLLCTGLKLLPLQLRRVMKLTAILLLAFCLQLSARTFSQTVSFTGKNVPLETVFKSLEKQTGLSFFFNYALIKNTEPVTIDYREIPLEHMLKEILKNQGLDFYQTGKTIFIIKRQLVQVDSLHLQGLDKSQIDISGRVTNEQGESLAGASVSVKNGKKGTSTNEKGFFSLKGVSSDAVLVVTYTGYQRKELSLNGDGTLSITLSIANDQLDQAKVIAYGVTSQRLSTGNVVTVKSEDIARQPVANVLTAIEGRVPGMVITQSSGYPGSVINVQIRGQSSLISGTDPLYVIDGVPYISNFQVQTLNYAGSGGSPLSFINPAEIDNVSVLKDADATAIYGSRAANGAILITTKKGKAGKTKLDINVNEGVSVAPLKIHWMNNSQYLEMRREAFYNDGITPDSSNAPDIYVWDTTRYTNWQKTLLGGAAHYHDIQLNLSGGNASTQYVFGGGYHNETPVFPVSGADQNASAHLNIINTSADQRFRVNVTINYFANFTNLPQTDMASAIINPPDAPPPFNKDGSLNWADETLVQGNVYATLKRKYISKTNNLISNAVLNYKLLKGLDLKTNFGYTNTQINAISTSPIAALDPVYHPTGSINSVNDGLSSWILEPQMSYQTLWGRSHIDALAGSTLERNITDGVTVSGSGYTSDALLQNLQAAPIVQIPSSINIDYKYFALFGRLNYNYDDKYIFSANWRRDGSSRFGPANQYHNFGSVAAAWIFTKEELFQRLSWLSFGKIRGSYGTTGNDQIGDYRFYDLFSPTYTPYQGAGGLYPTALSNPNLQWEETKKAEIAMEFAFFRDALFISTSYYRNRSGNLLITSPLPQITGFTSIEENLPATVQNSGWEFIATANIKRSGKFRWTSSFNLSIPKNRLIAFPGLATSEYQNIYVIGKSITSQRLYHLTGVDPATGLYSFQSKTDPLNPVYPDDQIASKDPAPTYYGGWQNSFGYKGFQLDVFFHFRKQLGANYLLQSFSPPGNYANYPVGVLNRWRNPGDHATFERYSENFFSPAATSYAEAQGSDFDYVDASFIKFSNLSLSYQLSNSWVKRMHIENCLFFVHVQNVATITRYKGADPETKSLVALPPLRVFAGGISLAL